MALIGGLTIHNAAHAVLIGDFSWSEHTEEECAAGLCGPVFSVGNFSTLDDPLFGLGSLGGPFLDVFVDLETDTGPLSLLLDDVIDAFDSRQSFEDLSAPSISFAGLRLTFSVPSLPGSVRLLDFDGNLVVGLIGPGSLAIDYAIADIPAPVPEPATLLLLAGGLGVIAVARRAPRYRKPPTSRMSLNSLST